MVVGDSEQMQVFAALAKSPLAVKGTYQAGPSHSTCTLPERGRQRVHLCAEHCPSPVVADFYFHAFVMCNFRNDHPPDEVPTPCRPGGVAHAFKWEHGQTVRGKACEGWKHTISKDDVLFMSTGPWLYGWGVTAGGKPLSRRLRLESPAPPPPNRTLARRLKKDCTPSSWDEERDAPLVNRKTLAARYRPLFREIARYLQEEHPKHNVFRTSWYGTDCPGHVDSMCCNGEPPAVEPPRPAKTFAWHFLPFVNALGKEALAQHAAIADVEEALAMRLGCTSDQLHFGWTDPYRSPAFEVWHMVQNALLAAH